MTADQVWVCELFELESEDGRIVTGKGSTPLAATRSAIGMIAANRQEVHLMVDPAIFSAM